jgi:hypothetical protein
MWVRSQSQHTQYIVLSPSTGSAQAAHRRTQLERDFGGAADGAIARGDHFLTTGAALETENTEPHILIHTRTAPPRTA